MDLEMDDFKSVLTRGYLCISLRCLYGCWVLWKVGLQLWVWNTGQPKPKSFWYHDNMSIGIIILSRDKSIYIYGPFSCFRGIFRIVIGGINYPLELNNKDSILYPKTFWKVSIFHSVLQDFPKKASTCVQWWHKLIAQLQQNNAWALGMKPRKGRGLSNYLLSSSSFCALLYFITRKYCWILMKRCLAYSELVMSR